MDLKNSIFLIRLTLNGFTDGFVSSVAAALKLATMRGDHVVTPEHLFAGIATTSFGLLTLERLGLDYRDCQEEIYGIIEKQSDNFIKKTIIGDVAKKIIHESKNKSRIENIYYTGVEHMIFSLLNTECVASLYLHKQGLTVEALHSVLGSFPRGH